MKGQEVTPAASFPHHTSRALVAMIPPQHHCHLTNTICHLQLAVKQTAAKPDVSNWQENNKVFSTSSSFCIFFC